MAPAPSTNWHMRELNTCIIASVQRQPIVVNLSAGNGVICGLVNARRIHNVGHHAKVKTLESIGNNNNGRLRHLWSVHVLAIDIKR
jgi:hypothetical protein